MSSDTKTRQPGAGRRNRRRVALRAGTLGRLCRSARPAPALPRPPMCGFRGEPTSFLPCCFSCRSFLPLCFPQASHRGLSSTDLALSSRAAGSTQALCTALGGSLDMHGERPWCSRSGSEAAGGRAFVGRLGAELPLQTQESGRGDWGRWKGRSRCSRRRKSGLCRWKRLSVRAGCLSRPGFIISFRGSRAVPMPPLKTVKTPLWKHLTSPGGARAGRGPGGLPETLPRP